MTAIIEKSNYRMISLFAFIIISWGMAWPVNKIALTYMSPLWYTATQLIVGTMTMMAVIIAIKKFALPKRQDLPLIAVVGLLQISIYILLANIGLAYLPAGRSSLLGYITPLWVMPAATLFFNEKAGPLRWLGFCLAIVGLILLLCPWEMNWSDSHILFGTAMLLLASLCWAISMICARYMRWTKSPLELIPWQLFIGTIPILLFAWIKEPSISIDWNQSLILAIVYTGILVTGLSYWGGLVINKELPTIAVSIGFLAVPVFSLLVSALFMHEVISLSTAAAMSLILVGLICVAI
ncbi:MAG TPA: EamA family transporter [Gammaproteobacteria bacterium]|nr:EamA family transporter [Gammaproteobacteria bacterium]